MARSSSRSLRSSTDRSSCCSAAISHLTGLCRVWRAERRNQRALDYGRVPVRSSTGPTASPCRNRRGTAHGETFRVVYRAPEDVGGGGDEDDTGAPRLTATTLPPDGLFPSLPGWLFPHRAGAKPAPPARRSEAQGVEDGRGVGLDRCRHRDL